MHMHVVLQRLSALFAQDEIEESELKVWARWTDGSYYTGDVDAIYPDRNACRIVFFDVRHPSFCVEMKRLGLYQDLLFCRCGV